VIRVVGLGVGIRDGIEVIRVVGLGVGIRDGIEVIMIVGPGVIGLVEMMYVGIGVCEKVGFGFGGVGGLTGSTALGQILIEWEVAVYAIGMMSTNIKSEAIYARCALVNLSQLSRNLDLAGRTSTGTWAIASLSGKGGTIGFSSGTFIINSVL
jgi:hypothetical protein